MGAGDLTTMAEEEVGGGMLGSSWISFDRLVSVCDAVWSWFLAISGWSLEVESGAWTLTLLCSGHWHGIPGDGGWRG